MTIYLLKNMVIEYFFVILLPVKSICPDIQTWPSQWHRTLFRLPLLVVLLLLFLPQTAVAARDKDNTAILKRMFDNLEHYDLLENEKTFQVYTKHYFETYRRNFGLWLIPTMYTIARGDRRFLTEEYSKVTITGPDSYVERRQVFNSTIPRNSSTMSILSDFKTPNLHGATLYGNHLLSPFRRENSNYYKYKVTRRRNGQARIDFAPLVGDNTQLVSGTVIVRTSTGRILDADIRGEYDMLEFHTTLRQKTIKADTIGLPQYCKTDVTFKFLGNHIVSTSTSYYGCKVVLPDTVDVERDWNLMKKLRPVKLEKREREALQQQLDREKQSAKEERARQRELERQKAKGIPEDKSGWSDLEGLGYHVGTYLVSSHGADKGNFNFQLSPILKPQYVSYSKSRGLSYKLNLAFEYRLKENSALYMNPVVGYNFKLKKIYAHVPLQYFYNKEKGNYLELSWNTGNRIGNSSIIDELKEELGLLPELDSISLDEFDDYQLSLMNYTQLTPKLRMELGCVYHHRTAVNKEDMRRYGKPTNYRSLAPTIGVTVRPWKKGPVFSVNYERTIKSAISDLDYERWEGQVSQKFPLPSTRLINLRIGGGLYTRQYTNYFLDFERFSVNNLPEGWNDDWTGDFQLLDSRMYNISKYYFSTNISYDTPLMLTSFIPFIGHYVERERLYWSGLLIEYNRPYHEVGYGFSTRFFALGLFGSFHELGFKEFGMKFTVELFKRW